MLDNDFELCKNQVAANSGDDLSPVVSCSQQQPGLASQVWKLFRGQKVWTSSPSLLHPWRLPLTCFIVSRTLDARGAHQGRDRESVTMCYDQTRSERTFVSMPPVHCGNSSGTTRNIMLPKRNPKGSKDLLQVKHSLFPRNLTNQSMFAWSPKVSHSALSRR